MKGSAIMSIIRKWQSASLILRILIGLIPGAAGGCRCKEQQG